jgi:hypothetical protein
MSAMGRKLSRQVWVEGGHYFGKFAPMNWAGWLALVVALIFAFAGGAEWHAWRAREALKAHPCSVTAWKPNHQQFAQVTLNERTCLKLGPPQEVSGVWVDDPYSAKFTPDHPANLPEDLDLSLEWPQRTRLYSLAGLPGAAQQFSGRSFRVSIVGRLGNRGCCWTDARRNTIVVDDVTSARLEAKP